MKKIVFFVIVSTLIISCKTLSSYYLKGEYHEKPLLTRSTLNTDELWVKVESSLIANGIKDFKIFSKENGIIVSEPLELNNNYTREDTQGKLINPQAFVVIGNFHTISGKQLAPDSIKGVLSVRIKSNNGEQEIEIMLYSLRFLYTYLAGSEISREITDIPVKSTGMLEKSIINSILK